MTLFKIFLFAHIASGGTALLTGLISMTSAKGGRTHRLAGKIFFWGMAGVFATSLYMSLAKSNWFLLCVGFFSFYLTCSGYLVLKAKAAKTIDTVKPIYWIVCLFGFLAGVAMLILAANMFRQGYTFGMVPLVFGLLSAGQSFLDYRMITTDGKLKQMWLKSHAMRMAGAFVATLTAFTVVNIQIDQQWILWLLPTVVVIPVTRRMIAKFQSR
jgi:uncharacterized membrane protein